MESPTRLTSKRFQHGYIEDFSDEELQDELEERGYYVYDECMEDDEDELYDEIYDKVSFNNFTLPRLYNAQQLRDHLLDIVCRGHYLSDDELLDLLRKQLQS